MSSTLIIKTGCPHCGKGEKLWCFKHPFKAIFSRRYFDTDGSCGNGIVTLSYPEDYFWLQGVLDSNKLDAKDKKEIKQILKHLEEGSDELSAYHEH